MTVAAEVEHMSLTQAKVGFIVLICACLLLAFALWALDNYAKRARAADITANAALRRRIALLETRVATSDYWLMAFAHQAGYEFIEPDQDDSPRTEPIPAQKPTPQRRDDPPATQPQDAVLLAHWSTEAAARAGARAMELEDRIAEIRERTEQRNAARPKVDVSADFDSGGDGGGD